MRGPDSERQAGRAGEARGGRRRAARQASAVLLALGAAGCQITPTTLPVAEPAPAAECHWVLPGASRASRAALVGAGVAALEASGFTILTTDLTLGVVSAERRERLPAYLHPYDDWPYDHWAEPRGYGHRGYGYYGIGRGHYGFGLALGFGPPRRDATRLERVSLLVAAGAVRVSRDLQVLDWRGEARESRSASDAAYCSALRRDLSVVLRDEEAP